MREFGILMLIFGGCVFLVGLYMFTGHRLGIMTLRPAFKNLKKEDWKHIGKWTMVASAAILAIGVVGLVV